MEMNHSKRGILRLLLTLCLVIVMFPMTVGAQDTETGAFTVTGGTYGTDYTYDEINSNGVLDLNGHTFTYTDNGNGTHDKDCSFCDTEDAKSEPHVFDQENVNDIYQKSIALYYKSCSCGASSQGTDAEAVFEDRNYGRMQIFVKTLTGKHITFGVEPTDTIASLMERIAIRQNLLIENFQLAFAGKNLDAGKTLHEYSIQKDSTLILKPICPITYKDSGDAAFSGTLPATAPTTHTYGTETTLPVPYKTGYIFGGWFLNSACSGTAVTSLGAEDYIAAINLYALWTSCTHIGNTNTDDGDCMTAITCSVCGAEITSAQQEHTYDNDHDTNCNVKGCTAGNRDAIHSYGTEWESGKNKHWHECACGDKSDETEHSGGTATCTNKASCDVCGAAYGEKLAHTPKVVNKKDATTSEKGYTGDTICEICGYEIAKGEDIPAINTGTTYDEVLKTGDETPIVWLFLLLIGSGSVIVLLAMFLRKKKNTYDNIE